MSRFAQWTAGRWPEIVSSLLGPEQANTRKHLPCEMAPGSKDCFRFADFHENGSYFCRCSPDGKAGGFDLLQCRLGVDFMGAVRAVEGILGPCPRDERTDIEPRRETYGEILLREGVRVERSKYLESRGLVVPPGLLFHKAVDYRDADGQITGNFPAMLAPITRDGVFQAMHVTYLQGGAKAPVDTVRKILPGKRATGGAVELFPAAAKMGVGEGIESSLSAAALFGVPCFAALNTSLLKAFEPPDICTELLIYADNDLNFAGHAAAFALAHAQAGKRKVEVLMPSGPDEDWNTVLMEKLSKERKRGEI